jgi:hypothetical protein
MFGFHLEVKAVVALQSRHGARFRRLKDLAPAVHSKTVSAGLVSPTLAKPDTSKITPEVKAVVLPTAGKTREQMKREAVELFRKAGLLDETED